ncbi:hypothetical protein GCM10008021_14790 [Deinococcus wulumuqiensis]|nr:hypothetical protein GCM10008021_14790 [Deinococcus wulumuqiensis]
MRIHHPPFAFGNDLHALGDQEERGQRQNHDEPIQARDITQLRRLQPVETTFIVQEALFDLEAFAVLGERLQTSRLTAHDLPLLLSVCRSSERHMDWAKNLPSDRDVVETPGLSGLKSNFVQFAQALTLQVSKDQVRLDTDAVVPTTGPEPIHEFSVTKTPVSKEPDVTNTEHVKDAFDTGEQGEKLTGRNLGTFVFDHFLVQWKSASTEKNRKANQAEVPKEHTGVQREHQTVLAPMLKSLEDERRVGLEGINLRVLQKPPALNLSALRKLRFRDSSAHPRRNGAGLAFQTACNKPSAGVRVADIVPGKGTQEGANILVESGNVPKESFCRHKQKLSPIGDVFSSSLSGRQIVQSSFATY